MYESLHERIAAVIKAYEKGNKAAFANKIGIPANTLHGYLNDQGQSKIKVGTVIRILEEYDVDAGWLLLGKGGMTKEPDELSEFERTDPVAKRMRYAVRLMEEYGGSKEEIRSAIMLALKGAEA